MLFLKGWYPGYESDLELLAAIESGQIVVTYSEKDKFDYLKGEYVNKYGVVVSFK